MKKLHLQLLVVSNNWGAVHSKGFSTLLHFAMSSYKRQSAPTVTCSKGTLASSAGDRLKFRLFSWYVP